MTDSWEAFAQALSEESLALATLSERATALSTALVNGAPAAISSAERALDAARIAYARAAAVRRGMQVRGFGERTLRDVCARAPRGLSATLALRLRELTNLATGVRIATANNKALILGGMDRLMKITGALQRAASDEAGTYKRRGFVPPPRNSVLVSSRA